jgi:hypothetical protein
MNVWSDVAITMLVTAFVLVWTPAPRLYVESVVVAAIAVEWTRQTVNMVRVRLGTRRATVKQSDDDNVKE